MSLTIKDAQGYIFAECKELVIHGLPGLGSYTCCLNLDFNVNTRTTEIFLRHVNLRVDWDDNAQRMIGIALPEGSQPIRISISNQQHMYFRFLLSHSQLESIESLRAGGNFNLRLYLSGEVSQGTQSGPFSEYAVFPVRQADWINALKNMGFQKTIIYEIPLPDFSENSRAAQKHFERAQALLYQGHFDDSVGECRKIFELLEIDKAGNILGSARNKYHDDRENLSIQDRMALLKDIIKLFTHKPHHANQTEEYSRDQAKLILGSTIAYFCAMPKKHDE
ncbi:MAG: hypothetical protein KZQ97_09810 [Candidatus Thiodiazotropha sp. (ex Dulcina madagascariensis)]|nr:hypothetical protein [Candidatus Thiodiazotropha sp. (ex Dulcina madagascariensis)]